MRTTPRALAPLLTVSLGALTLGGCFTLDFDGDGEIDRLPPAGYEVDYVSCSNGRDDDQDGRIDCQDEDCLMNGHCGEQIPNAFQRHPENSFSFCIDGVDNDEDGQFDCGDRGCQDIRELCCLSEFDDASCSDGIDNDGNGFADCADFSCRNGVFVTVCEAETDCTDREDNDGDRRTDCNDSDCASDPVCAGPPESSCTDGMDNDDDGDVDCADRGCQATADCTGAENTVARCQDGFDNDGNGFTDCDDFGCTRSMDPAVLAVCMNPSGEAEDTLAKCMDGIDNDGNRYTDCADNSCRMSPNGEILAYCAARAEVGADRCSDGVDNDENGFVDCDDNSCRFSTDAAVRAICEANLATCTDGIDNNRNGFVDCADYSCQFVSFELAGRCDDMDQCPGGLPCFRGSCVSVTSPCQEGAEPGGNYEPVGGLEIPMDLTEDERQRIATAGCTDGRDDDADGFIDCEDWDCNYNPFVVNADGTPLCRFAGGRTCTRGANAGRACTTHDDCPGATEGCGPPGPAGQVMVCP